LTDEPFTKKDIIMLQDPHNLEKRDLTKFHYINQNQRVVNKAEEIEKRKPINNINVAGMGNTKKIFDELEKNKKKDEKEKKEVVPVSFHQKKSELPYNAAHYTTGEAAESFTSTAMNAHTASTRALIDEEEFMFKKIKAKSYARIQTNYGDLNIELFSDRVPRTCYNFMQLAKKGYYDNVIFHRNIKKFMGGDPTGTGKGGESLWGHDFPDEIKSTLKHDTKGVISMANKGKDTNGSQFFITYAPAPQLDGQHTVFGKVVGGLDVLKKLELIPVDKKDRPEREIKMKQIQILVDPFEEYMRRLKTKLSYASGGNEALRQKKEKEDKMGWFGPSTVGSDNDQVGKYLQQQKKRPVVSSASSVSPETIVTKKPKTQNGSYGNFDNF